MANNDNSPKIPYSRTNDENQDEFGGKFFCNSNDVFTVKMAKFRALKLSEPRQSTEKETYRPRSGFVVSKSINN
ncbi:hypothetical protein HUJ05_002464 [Dendroctonus ponderosae]|nr:hypothetical protein HUJ05_002464 [Dendroctonus ponderosae]